MLDSGILEIAIGVSFVFLSVSLICSAVREAIETVMKTRARDLERGLRELLDDQHGTGLVKELFNHPRIYALFGGSYDPNKRGNLPSYIPAAQFSAALMDLVVRRPGAGHPYPTPPLSIDSLRSAAAVIDNDRVKRAILSAVDMAEGDIGRVRLELENWFDGTMDRVSGWYKRRTQLILLVIGLGAAVLLNIDAITIVKRLGEDETLRKAVVTLVDASGDKGTENRGAPVAPAPPGAPPTEASEDISASRLRMSVSDIQQIRAQFNEIGLPIGWSAGWPAPQYAASCEAQPRCELSGGTWFQIVIGWLITALAVMLGAPFWFDLLNKFMVIRSTVKPHEKSPEEGSEDRAASPAPPVAAADERSEPRTSVAAGPGPGTVPRSVPLSDYVPNKWNTDTAESEEEGIV